MEQLLELEAEFKAELEPGIIYVGILVQPDFKEFASVIDAEQYLEGKTVAKVEKVVDCCNANIARLVVDLEPAI